MSLLTDIISSIKSSKSTLYAELKRNGIDVKNTNLSVIQNTFKQGKTGNKSFVDFASKLIASKIKSKADGETTPLEESIAYVLGGGYDEEEYRKAIQPKPYVPLALVVLLILVIYFAKKHKFI